MSRGDGNGVPESISGLQDNAQMNQTDPRFVQVPGAQNGAPQVMYQMMGHPSTGQNSMPFYVFPHGFAPFMQQQLQQQQQQQFQQQPPQSAFHAPIPRHPAPANGNGNVSPNLPFYPPQQMTMLMPWGTSICCGSNNGETSGRDPNKFGVGTSVASGPRGLTMCSSNPSQFSETSPFPQSLASFSRTDDNMHYRAGVRRRPRSSKYRGVSWHKRGKKWIARIWVQQRSVHLGVFSSEIKAALAVDKKLIEMDDRSQLNFPDDSLREQLFQSFRHDSKRQQSTSLRAGSHRNSNSDYGSVEKNSSHGSTDNSHDPNEGPERINKTKSGSSSASNTDSHSSGSGFSASDLRNERGNSPPENAGNESATSENSGSEGKTKDGSSSDGEYRSKRRACESLETLLQKAEAKSTTTEIPVKKFLKHCVNS